ncbi:calcium-dependent protein kinase 1, putative [Perkinsus marinus ATCC 50983]|uniref:Calcium-dependent protein kinase 1, putative n=1 Tax=Perkinsus marinus (strain ATCC 50983 / TXsc) TaxID=423536 RepID=C5LM50_PERM5|nr:calcium-dependent protein kinase 1, putative [Perkinsus marinus ATCC 50983]EER02181.1 calcium-dependent protein kinase 1, putative [Perkinsus marinus ATCC 50983]|eukprot:XP_002769463.1 calcium-dependent protein kinase 1, putative [Perkinsus marinus ATCC 50983]
MMHARLVSCNKILSEIQQEESRDLRMAKIVTSVKISDVYDFDGRILGTGVSGSVRSITNRRTGQQSALKKLPTWNLSKKKYDQLYNEVAIFLRLDHPNIVRLREVYEDRESASRWSRTFLYMVMEKCSGGELFDRLKDVQRFSEADAAGLVKQMFSAVNYCHEHNICHRDLKLENWMFLDKSPNSPLKLIDFGFSQRFTSGVPLTRVCGTCFYVAPEVLKGTHDQKCDIWSLGVITYMLLSGMPPFTGRDEQAILRSVRAAKYSFSASVWDDVSQEAKEFIMRLLTKDPARRPSCKEALQDPWLRKTWRGDQEPSLDTSVLTNLYHFAAAGVMKRAALGLIAMTMSTPQVRQLEEQFRVLDKDGNGVITLEELTTALTEKLNMTREEARTVFSKLDVTGNHEIHYSEFLAASLELHIADNESLILDAFRKMDRDGSGGCRSISLENLRTILGEDYMGTRIEEIIKECDINGDGQIQYEEFVALVTDGRGFDSASESSSPRQRGHSLEKEMKTLERLGTIVDSETDGEGPLQLEKG